MKTRQTKTNENRYDLCVKRKLLAPSDVIFCSPVNRSVNDTTLLNIYHELVMMKEPTLKKWVLANCKFASTKMKSAYAIFAIHPASKAKLDKHLATDPLGLAEEAIRQEWTDKRTIVVQRGKLVYDWKVRIAKRK